MSIPETICLVAMIICGLSYFAYAVAWFVLSLRRKPVSLWRDDLKGSVK